jgi:putative transcriptional regulator
MNNEYDTLMDAPTGILADPTSSDLPVPSVIDVQAIRNKTGLTQAAFASRIGVPVGTLRNWEQGHRSPTGFPISQLRTNLQERYGLRHPGP